MPPCPLGYPWMPPSELDLARDLYANAFTLFINYFTCLTVTSLVYLPRQPLPASQTCPGYSSTSYFVVPPKLYLRAPWLLATDPIIL
ncbi:hypothetical protein EYC84_008894 [Monilinia fructicola]|uniref:Uncharacterized protein n=1 Tax=Monilinia fructicola TaxID=38448 RepID=A0A5M9JAN5_MONFR|nr:hypothetical protein EYC84_008894 [Monilinia fructicola]